jgi:nucleotidyltransferase/DNA polymerase involved in DNA repair
VIEHVERRKMLAVPMCGPRVISRLESIGVRHLADLRNRDPHDIMTEVNLEAGRPIWRPPIVTLALSNLIHAAAAERRQPKPATKSSATPCRDSTKRATRGSLALP